MAIIFLIVGLFLCMTVGTIEEYGLDYDAGIHMVRGEYLLHFYRTGETDYQNLPERERCKFQFPDPEYPHQSAHYVYKVYKRGTTLGAISSAVTCLVFYKYLNWLGPVDAHNLATLIYAAISILVLYLLALEAFGRKVAVLSSLFLFFHPPFIGYSHVLIKDLPVFCFVTLSLWSFWKGVTKNQYRWIVLFLIFAGAGMAAKMNAAYALIISVLWLVVPIRKKIGIFARLSPKFWVTLLISPLIIILTYMSFAPKIWYRDPYNFIQNIKETYEVMVGIHTYVAAKDKIILPNETRAPSDREKKKKSGKKPSSYGNLLRRLFYAPLHALVTTPVLLLAFALLGAGSVITNKSKGKDGAEWLVLIWAVVPVGFCTLPFVFIHSGIREFLPFVAGVCLLAGLGAESLYKKAVDTFKIPAEKASLLFLGVLSLALLPQIVSVIQYHPYELAFINRLTGGLAGAQNLRLPSSSRKGIPQIGDTRGSSFRNALGWVDKNGQSPSIVIIWATSSRFIPLNNDMTIIPDGWDYSAKTRLKLKKRNFKTVYIIFNHMYWNLTHPLYGYCYKNLSPIYTAKANGAPVSYVYQMSREEFFQLVIPQSI